MTTARQLYQLQELDLAITSEETALRDKTGRLGESPAFINARNRLAASQQRLDELKHQQRSTEYEIDDLTAKIRAIDEKLYGGRIRNPKELEGFQQEADAFKAKRDKLETGALELMDRIESAQKDVVRATAELKKTETEWQGEQQKLSGEIEDIKTKLVDLRQKRQSLADEVDPKSLELYNYLRKAKVQAVVRVEQGICRGCRISLPSSDLQQARGRNLVHCSSCGRVLFLP
jgi:predicted  nucleic acid-binding Zn-ribbon protein